MAGRLLSGFSHQGMERRFGHCVVGEHQREGTGVVPDLGFESCAAQVGGQHGTERALIGSKRGRKSLEGFSANLPIRILHQVAVRFRIKPDLLAIRLHARPWRVRVHENVVNADRLLAQSAACGNDGFSFWRERVRLFSQDQLERALNSRSSGFAFSKDSIRSRPKARISGLTNDVDSSKRACSPMTSCNLAWFSSIVVSSSALRWAYALSLRRRCRMAEIRSSPACSDLESTPRVPFSAAKPGSAASICSRSLSHAALSWKSGRRSQTVLWAGSASSGTIRAKPPERAEAESVWKRV
jgi:hypothetical protein